MNVVLYGFPYSIEQLNISSVSSVSIGCRFNRTIKEEYTLYEKMPIDVFLQKAVQMVTERSRKLQVAPPTRDPVPKRQLLVRAHQWVQAQRGRDMIEENDNVWFVPASSSGHSEGRAVFYSKQHYKELSHFSELQYSISANSWYKVSESEFGMPVNVGTALSIWFAFCKHIVGIQHLYRNFTFPTSAVSIGHVRQMGRRQKHRGAALIIQYVES